MFLLPVIKIIIQKPPNLSLNIVSPASVKSPESTRAGGIFPLNITESTRFRAKKGKNPAKTRPSRHQTKLRLSRKERKQRNTTRDLHVRAVRNRRSGPEAHWAWARRLGLSLVCCRLPRPCPTRSSTVRPRNTAPNPGTPFQGYRERKREPEGVLGWYFLERENGFFLERERESKKEFGYIIPAVMWGILGGWERGDVDFSLLFFPFSDFAISNLLVSLFWSFACDLLVLNSYFPFLSVTYSGKK